MFISSKFSSPLATDNISDNFFLERSVDGAEYVRHEVVRDEGAASARYLMGYLVPFVRAHILPQGKIKIKSFDPSLSEADTKIDTNVGDKVLGLGSAQNDFVTSEEIVVTNEADETFNYFINI